jgi:two-component sensor histidine kinase
MRNFLIQNLSPKALFSVPVFLFSLGWGITTNLLNIVYNPPELYLERILILMFSHLVMFSGIFLGLSLLRLLPQLAQSLLMLPLILVAAMMRGYTNWVMFSFIGIDSPEELTYRVFGGLTNMGLALTFSAIAVHRIRNYTENRKKLLAESYRLLDLRKTAREQIKVSTDSKLREIRSQILDSLSLDRAQSAEKSMQVISRTIDGVVRPLSQQIENEQLLTYASPEDVKKVKLNWPEALLGALDPKFLNPVAVTLCTIIGAFTFISTTNTLEDTMKLLALAMVGTWGLVSLIKLVLVKAHSRLPKPAAIALWVLLIPVPGIGVSLLSLLVTLQTPNPYAFLLIGPYFVTGLSILFSLTGSSQALADVTSQRLEENTQKLAWEVARVSGEHRRLQRSLSHLVHGRIQSGLTSSLLRLKQAVESDPESFAKVEQKIHAELVQLINTSTLDDLDSVPTLDSVISRINQTWEDIAESSLDLNGITEDEISKDAVLLTNLAELIPELAFNAIRHGGANKVSFSLSLATEITAELTCVDNGERPSDSGRVGLGTKLLDECALRWKRQPMEEGIGTTTEVMLPYSPIERAKA